MKKNYQRPTMRVVITKQMSHILVGSGGPYTVSGLKDGGTETISDEDW